MKVLIQGYNTCRQNVAGGVSQRISSFMEALKKCDVECKVFDYWNDKIDNYDLVHFFKVQPDHYALANYLKHKNIPYVISTIVPIEKKYWVRMNCLLSKIKVHTLIGMNRVLMSNASIVLTESLQEKRYLEVYYGIEGSIIHTIPNGVDLNECEVDENLFLNKYQVIKGFVLCVGRVDPNKNQLNLIKALNNTNIQLVIVGGPDPQNVAYFEECKRIAATNVIFTGWIPADDLMLKTAYRCAKVVVLPSFRETFGNVILEGAINHANIAFSETLAISDWGLDKYAYTFDPNDVKMMRQVIKTAYDSPVNERLFDFVQEHFTWDAVAREHINLYRRVL